MANTEPGNSRYLSTLTALPGGRVLGKVRQVIGLVIEVSGVRPFIGEICKIRSFSARFLSPRRWALKISAAF